MATDTLSAIFGACLDPEKIAGFADSLAAIVRSRRSELQKTHATKTIN
jgi:hypothetical protein